MSFKIPTKQEFRAEFHRLKAQQAQLEAQLAPLEADYAEVRDQECKFHDEHVQPKIDAMTPIKDQLHEVNVQMGQIVRFLRDVNGVAQTGDDPSGALPEETEGPAS